MAFVKIRTEKCPVCGKKPIIKAKADEFSLDFDGVVEVSCKRLFRRPHLQVFANHEDLCTAISMAVATWNYKVTKQRKETKHENN